MLYLYYTSAGYQTNLIKQHLIQRTHAATAPGSLTSVSRHLAKGWHRASALGYGEGETNTWHEKREREGERVENRRCGIEEVKRRRGRMTDIKKVEKLLR